MPELWPFEPNSLKVALSWASTVLMAYSREQRARHREAPRLEFEMTHILEDDRVTKAKMLVEKAQDSEWYVPDWRYAQYVAKVESTDTIIPVDLSAVRIEVGDTVVLWQNEDIYATGTVGSIGADQITLDAPVGLELFRPVVAPRLAAYGIGDFSFSVMGNSVKNVSAKFGVRKYKDLSGDALTETVFQTFPVMLDRTIRVTSIANELERVVHMIDNGTGPVALEPVFDHIDYGDEIGFYDTDRDTRFEREVWLHKRYGKQKPFWLPTWTNDHDLLYSALSAATSIIVRSRGDQYIGRRILILMNDGTAHLHEILGQSLAGEEMTLTINPGLSADVAPANIKTFCDLNLVRLDTDEIDMVYGPGLSCEFDANVVGLNNEL